MGREAMDGEARKFRNFEALAAADGGSPAPAVLVLGGSTFMGRALVERLVARPARLCVVNRGRTYWGTDDPSCGKAARLMADRRDAKAFATALDEATRRLGGSAPRWDLVADFSAFNGPDIRAALDGLQGRFDRYVYISSDSVYEVSAWAGECWLPRPTAVPHAPLVVEGDSERPAEGSRRRALKRADGYGDGKLEAEEALAAGLAEHSGSGPGLALRLPDVIGPFDDTLRLWAFWHWLQAGPQEPPQVHDPRSVKRPRRSLAEDGGRSRQAADGKPSEELLFEEPDTVPLTFVFSHDVARFIDGLLDSASATATAPPPSFDAVNLACQEQPDLRGFLGLLATASGLQSPPRLAEVEKPRTFLPSVERPWNLSCQRMLEVYRFTPTPLADVLKSCAEWFAKGCDEFPRDALRAAMKLPPAPRKLAIQRSGLTATPSSSSSSAASSSDAEP
mmetsp:Transcript_135584/g.433762  ORF Transcript_135584/g.433762 Transcript_135584/m.433762 type:complete len:450 (-) Transcript_135584:118-1467(-)